MKLFFTRFLIYIDLIYYFYPALNVRSTLQENSCTNYNSCKKLCLFNIANNHVIMYLLIQLSSIYVATSLSYPQHSMSAYHYLKRKYFFISWFINDTVKVFFLTILLAYLLLLNKSIFSVKCQMRVYITMSDILQHCMSYIFKGHCRLVLMKFDGNDVGMVFNKKNV